MSEHGAVGVKTWTGEEGVEKAREHVLDLAERYTVAKVAADPWRWAEARLALQRLCIRCSEFPQTDVRMCPASQRLRDAIVRREVTLPDDPVLTQHAASAVQRHTRRGWHKPKAVRYIGMVG